MENSSYADFALIELNVSPPPIDIDQLRLFVQTKCDECKFAGNCIQYLIYYCRLKVPEKSKFFWKEEFKDLFPSLVEWIDSLPFRRLYGVDLVTQTASVDDHLDIFGYNNAETHLAIHAKFEPIYYRVVFTDNPERISGKSFYVARKFHGRRNYLLLGGAATVFAMNSSICYHGSKYNKGCFKSTLALYGELDYKRHVSLLKSSLECVHLQRVQYRTASPVRGPGEIYPYPGSK